ncbi:MAG: biotin/lipoyl-binding protein, partial [Planctomycetota bacterium]
MKVHLLLIIAFVASIFCDSLYSQNSSEFSNAVVGLIDDVRVPVLDSGQIIEINVKPGQKVSKDEVLARLDTRQLEAQRAVIETELKIAEQGAENEVDIQYARSSSGVANRVLQRSREANQLISRSVTQTEIERLRLEAERAGLSIKQAEIELDAARMQID